MKRKDYKNLIVLEIITILLMLFLTKGKYIFGANNDFISQNILFADYFRKLFYNSGKFFPQFALNIGNGQNIYYFGYYGLFSPIYLISYFLPFIKMSTYIQIAMLVMLVFTIQFYYKWVRRRFDTSVSFIISLLILTSASIIFHTTKKIMFVSYLPFLLLGLYGIDEYFDKDSRKSKVMIAFSVLGMILSNYIFIITEILTLFLYGIYVSLENEEFHFKDFLINLFQLLKPIIFGVLFSMFFILPTLYAVSNGKIVISNDISILNLLLPNFNLNTYLYTYNGYGIGMLLIFAIIHALFTKNTALKILSIILLIFTVIPIFAFMFNGGMYLEYSSFIAFIPLIGLIVGYFINDLSKVKLSKISIIITVLFVVISSILEFKYFIIVDLIVVLLALIFLLKKNVFSVIFISLYLVAFGLIPIFMRTDLVSKSNYNKIFDIKIENSIKKLLNKENNIYRFNYLVNQEESINNIMNTNYYSSFQYSSLANKNNRKSYLKVFKNEDLYGNGFILSPTSNVLYNIYTANKYVYSKNINMYGYNSIKKNIYKSDDVFPLGYSTYKVMNLDYFKTLEYPYNIEALMNYIVVDENRIINDYETHISKYHYNVDNLFKNIKNIKKKDDKYYITNNSNKELVIKINEDNTISNKILFISFNMDYNSSCNNKEQSIEILDQKNVYSCKGDKYHNKNKNFTYTISLDQVKDRTIRISKGKYVISDLKLYILDYENVKDIKKSFDEFIIDKEKSTDNKLVGTIDTKEYGYFNISLPYDYGFDITLDGKSIGYKKTDLNYIGFKIDPGHHNIIITYKAPLSKFGRILSSISILIFIIYLFDEDLLKQSTKIKNRFDIY